MDGMPGQHSLEFHCRSSFLVVISFLIIFVNSCDFRGPNDVAFFNLLAVQ